VSKASRLTSFPLATWERDGLKAALTKAGLPFDDIAAPDRLFWRFETDDLVPVGFGGIEVHGKDALLRSIVTLPPVRRRGVGAAITAMLEVEARVLGCRTVWLLTASNGAFFERLGYAHCERALAPEAIQKTQQFATLCPAWAALMVKHLT
jgi:amino-acid N-acetyltransferase